MKELKRPEVLTGSWHGSPKVLPPLPGNFASAPLVVAYVLGGTFGDKPGAVVAEGNGRSFGLVEREQEANVPREEVRGRIQLAWHCPSYDAQRMTS